jgi:hypothetical protein
MKSKTKYCVVEDGEGFWLRITNAKNPVDSEEILVAEYENLKDAERRLCLEIQKGE